MTSNATSNVCNKNKNDWIPDGFVLVKGPDDEKYLVPEFMVQALDQDFHSNKKKELLNAFKFSGTVSYSAKLACRCRNIMAPACTSAGIFLTRLEGIQKL